MSNPFLDSTTPTSDDLAGAGQQRQNFAWSRGNTNAFGSPLPPSPISNELGGSSPAFGTPITPQIQRGLASPATDEIPLYTQSTQYATPAASVLYSYNPPSGGWPTNGSGTHKSTFETESIPVSTKSSGGGGRLSRFWGGGSGKESTVGSTTSTAFNLPAGTPTSPSDLHRREAELQRREADLARREASLAAAGAARKNWPKYLKLVHHDINADIPATRRSLVRAAYFAWCLVATGYIYNFICITIFFIGGEKKVSLWVFAGLVAVAGLPLSFLCWYRGIYWAAARDTGARWGWAILHLLAHIVWCWWMFVGITPNLGGYSAGLFTMIDQFSNGGGKGTAFGVLSVINMIIFAVCGVISMGVLGKVWATLRNSSASSAAVPVVRV